MSEQLIQFATNLFSMVLGIIIGSYITSKLLTRKIEKLFKKYAEKYGITENRVRGILESLAEFFGVEI